MSKANSTDAKNVIERTRKATVHVARFDLGAFNAKPHCVCGHSWANHIIPGGVDNLDIYPNQRHCVDCSCRDYTEPVRRSDEHNGR